MIRSPLLLLLGVFGVGVAAGAVSVASWLWFGMPEPPVPVAAADAVVAPELLLIGSGAVTGAYFPTGGAICRLMNTRRQGSGPLCAAPSTDGSLDNLTALRQGRVHLAIVQSDWQFHAYHGNLDFAEAGPNRDLRSILSIYKEPLTIVARRDTGAADVADLRGRRISIGKSGSGPRAAMEGLLSALGWDQADYAEVRDLGGAAQFAAFCAGELDAIAFATGHPNGLVHEATAYCDGMLISLAGADADRLIAENPYYAKTMIPGGLYPGSPDPIASVGVAATLVGSAALAPEIVYGVVSAIFDELGEMRLMHPAFGDLREEDMIRDGLTAPLHDGAGRYYSERGWM